MSWKQTNQSHFVTVDPRRNRQFQLDQETTNLFSLLKHQREPCLRLAGQLITPNKVL